MPVNGGRLGLIVHGGRDGSAACSVSPRRPLTRLQWMTTVLCQRAAIITFSCRACRAASALLRLEAPP